MVNIRKKYFFRYFIKTCASIGTRQDIESNKHLGFKFNIGRNEIGLISEKYGLTADCYIYDSNSFIGAENKSKILLENIFNVIDFSMSSASHPPLFLFGYDASPGLNKREFKQCFYFLLNERNIVPINKKIFGEIFEKSNKTSDERIIRAISWLRKGYFEEKHIDKFIAFWTGLEAINELLDDFYKISDEERRFHCPHCGKSLFYITAGVEKLFIDELKLSKKQFDEIRRTRGKLLHGGGHLDNNFAQKIEEYNPTVQKALILGIGKLLRMDLSIIKEILNQVPRKYTEEIRLVIKSNLINFTPLGLERFGKQPRLELDKNLVKRQINNKGKLNLERHLELKRINAKFSDDFSVDLLGNRNTIIDAKINNIK